MTDFDYSCPASLNEAINLLASLNGNSIIMAGGTDVIPWIHQHKLSPCHIVDVKSIKELSAIIADNDDSVRIGAAVRVHNLMQDLLIKERYPALVKAASVLGSYPVRCQATIGGNVCRASPAGDLLSPLLLYEARANLCGPSGWRIVPLEDFFCGPGETDIARGEILVELILPSSGELIRSTYFKQSPRGAMDIATVGIAVGLEFKIGNPMGIRIALGGVGSTPFRARKTEHMWLERGMLHWKEVGILAANECQAIDDLRAGADYRRRIVQVQVARLLQQLSEIHNVES